MISNTYLSKINLDGYNVADDIEHMLFDVVNFCGCGMPEDVLIYIRKGLLLVEQLELSWRSENKEDDYKKWDEDKNKFFCSEGAFYFFYYWCDKENFTEHGGSVPGWLSENGKEYLEALNYWYKLHLKEEK